jgi:hypothetical protein
MIQREIARTYLVVLSPRECSKSLRLSLNFLHEQFALRALVPYARARLNAGKSKTVSLWCPAALNLAARDPRFRLSQHDLLEPFTGVSDLHVVRAMNILHDGYFSADQTTRIAGHALRALREGGVFIVGRNENPGSPVSGGIYSKVGGRFESAWRSGGHVAECEPFILGAA